jgi:hypothetical protein
MAANTRTEFGSPTRATRPRVSAKRRVCEAPGCSTILSIYNGLPVCSAHELPRMRHGVHHS